VTGAAFSPDGKRVVGTACDGTTRVWDAATGEPRPDAADTPPDDSSKLAFSLDGRLRAEVDSDTIRVTDLRKPRCTEDVFRVRLAVWAVPDPTWHLRELESAEKAADWAAAFHAERLADLSPADGDARRRVVELWTKAGNSLRATVNAARLVLPLTPGP
jgi:WD40 repeat protein